MYDKIHYKLKKKKRKGSGIGGMEEDKSQIYVQIYSEQV